VILGLVGPAPAPAQETPRTPAPQTPATTFSETVRVEVVNVEVVVTDRQGKAVTGLTADDFEVFEDGEPRPIVNFYAEVGGRPRPAGGSASPAAGEAPAAAAAVPPEQQLHLLVFIDETHLATAHRNRVLDDLREFLTHRLEPSAVVSVVTLGRALRIHSDFLGDRAALGRILDEVEKQPSFNAAESVERRQLLGAVFQGEALGARGVDQVFTADLENRIRAWAQSEFERGRVTLDALSHFVATLAGIPGRKAMLYVADGVPQRPGQELLETLAGGANSGNLDLEREILDTDLLPQFEKLARQANAGRVTLYTLDAAGDHRRELRSAALGGRVPSDVLSTVEANYREPQERIADATGGRRLTAGAALEDDLEVLARDLTTFYSLGITPRGTAPDAGDSGENRRLRVEVRRPGLVVHAREGYQPKNPEQEIVEATLAALLYGTGSNPLEVSLEAGTAQPRDDGSSLLPVTVGVPLGRVTLLPRGDTQTGQLALFVTTQDAGGQPRPVQKIPFHAAVPADKVAELAGERLRYTLPLVVRPGDRRLSVGVWDEIGGVSSTVRLDLPAQRPTPPPPSPRSRP
jgi:VWFA-related protein